MAALLFNVQGLLINVQGYALGPYRPYTIVSNGQRIKNPKFDTYSQHVLNLKFPDKPQYFNRSVIICFAALKDFLGKTAAHIDQAEILIVPSSKKGQTSLALEVIAKQLCKVDKRFSYRPGSLARVRSIEKLATGGPRSMQIHLDSMHYVDSADAPPMKIILDDVLTTGNSIAAAINIVLATNNHTGFFPVVFGKTTHD